MKLISRLTVAFGLTLAMAAGALAQEAGAARLVLSQPSWDFGKVWEADHPVLTLTIKNEGTADLRIKDVRTTCACTAAQPERNVVPPGESTSIRVQFDTHGKQGDVSSKVIITSNDLTQNDGKAPGETHFEINGFVNRAITRVPLGGLVIKTLDPKPGHTSTVRLENQMDEPMHLELISNSLRELEVEIKEVTPGKVYDVVGRTARDLTLPRVRGQLVFKTGLKREPEFTVHVALQLLSRVEPSPRAMLLRADDAQSAKRGVSFQFYGTDNPEKFRVTEATCKNKDVQLTIHPPQPPAAWQKALTPPITAVASVTVMLPPATTLPPEGLILEFKTTDPDFPTIEIPVLTNKERFQAIMYGPTAAP